MCKDCQSSRCQSFPQAGVRALSVSQGSDSQEVLCVLSQPASAQLHCCKHLLGHCTGSWLLPDPHRVCSRRYSSNLIAACLAGCMSSYGSACGQAMEATAGVQVVPPQLATS